MPAERRPGIDPDLPPLRAGRMFALLRPYRWPLAGAGILLLLTTGIGLALPLAIRQLIDSVFVQGDARLLNAVAIGLLALFALQAVASFGQSYLVSAAGERLGMDLSQRLVTHLLRLSLRYHDTHKAGELMTLVGSDALLVRSGTMETALPLLSQVVTLVGSVGVASFLNWRLTLVVLVAGVGTAGIAVLLGRRIRAATLLGREQLGQATAVLNESLATLRIVKAFGRETYENDRFRDRMLEVLRVSLRRARIQSTLGPLIGLVSFSALTAVLWFGGREVLAARLTAGELIAFLIYLVMVAGPIGALSRLYAHLQQALGAGQRIFALLDEAPQIVDRPGAIALPTAAGRVAFERVSFRYAPDRPVVDDVTFTVEPGQTVALVGPSGAGKTTLIALLLRLYDVTAGRITVGNVDIRDATQESLRAGMALVPQEPVLFGASVAENIRYGRLDATAAAIERAARAANAHDFVAALPQGYDTEVGERGVQLSAGQRQRIAIARAILRDPALLLLDEATASLDNESEYLVQEALDRLMQGRTTIVVAHRLTTVERADRIVVLDAGRVVEQGTPAELVTSQGLYHRLLTRTFAAVAPL
ncbi:MAG: ABC transporter ATP-binding protein/permease [Chloroflexota bacterium]|nr:ABC transporter ATP-binding protein/permease [Chloroflexota bacterium]